MPIGPKSCALAGGFDNWVCVRRLNWLEEPSPHSSFALYAGRWSTANLWFTSCEMRKPTSRVTRQSLFPRVLSLNARQFSFSCFTVRKRTSSAWRSLGTVAGQCVPTRCCCRGSRGEKAAVCIRGGCIPSTTFEPRPLNGMSRGPCSTGMETVALLDWAPVTAVAIAPSSPPPSPTPPSECRTACLAEPVAVAADPGGSIIVSADRALGGPVSVPSQSSLM
mmetsp:Transcript_14188/g.34580  ORF Transcript_14188/g.34580 Transcript_14188/m.34580 type:complete len:221 (+) Transcript_14188:897-1559(+)